MDGSVIAAVNSRKIKLFLILSVITFIFALRTEAAVLLDTGVIPCDDRSCSRSPLGSPRGFDDQWAARFTLERDTLITGFSFWMNSSPSNIGESFTLSVYQGDILTPYSFPPWDSGISYTPDISNQVMSQHVTIVDTGAADNFDNQWQTLSGLSLALDQGSYWLGFSITGSDGYDGGLPSGEFGALTPVDKYAFFNSLNVGAPFTADGWTENSPDGFAFKVMGDVSPVPLPAAVWLFGAGLAGIFGCVRKKQAQA